MSVATVRTPGHSATPTTLRRTWTLAWVLAVTEWRLRFYGSFLGYLWSLARPFALFGVIYLVFSEFAKLGDAVPHYAVCILVSIVLFQFFAEIAGGSVQSLVARESLLRKVRFPRLVIPLSIVLTALFNVGMTMVAVMIFALLNGVAPMWSWLQLPLLIGILMIFASGIGMLLSALFVRFRDIAPIWDVIQQAAFYASPILYVATQVPEQYRSEFLLNPLAAVLTQARHALIDPNAPSIFEAMGEPWHALIPAGLVIGVFVLGLWVFQREAPNIAENL
jgi:ABC-2 type transport system permease protein